MSFLFKKIDWQLNIAILILIITGLLSLLSSNPDFFHKQLYWIAVAVMVAVILIFSDLRSFFSHKTVVRGLYILIVITLIFAFFFAPRIKGNRSWIVIGSFQFQPSEFAKVVLIIALAYFFSKAHIGIGRWKIVATSFFYFAVLGGLIGVLPDMGSAFVLFSVWFGFLLVSGMPFKKVLLSACFIFGYFCIDVDFNAKTLSKRKGFGDTFSRKGPDGLQLPCYSIENSHRFGRNFWQRLQAGDSGSIGFFA